jgi:hypothetical protein
MMSGTNRRAAGATTSENASMMASCPELAGSRQTTGCL